MISDHEAAGVTLDTLATAIDDLDAAAIGVDTLAASVKVGTLEEIADRRASVHNKRIGATRAGIVALRETIERQEERTSHKETTII